MSDAKSFLQQVELFDRHIDSKLEELAQLKELATKITSTWKQDSVSGGSDQDKIGNAVAKIIDMESDIDRAVDEFVDKKREVSHLIEKIQNPDQVAVLYKRYFHYQTWEQIACEMHMTYRNICYIHGKALQAVADLLAEK